MATVRAYNPYHANGAAPATNEQQPQRGMTSRRTGDAFEWVDGDNDESGPFRVMITGLPLDDVGDSDVKELFAHSVGENNVTSAKVLYDQNGLSMGIALVTLRRAADAKRAYQSFNDKAIDGQSQRKVHIIYIIDPSEALPTTIATQLLPQAPVSTPTQPRSSTSQPLYNRIPSDAAPGPSFSRAQAQTPTAPKSQRSAVPTGPKKTTLNASTPTGPSKKVASKAPATSSKSLLSRIDVSLKDRIGGMAPGASKATTPTGPANLPRGDTSSPAYQAALIQAQKARKAAANAQSSTAGQQLSHRLQHNPKMAARAANYIQQQKQANGSKPLTPKSAPIQPKADKPRAKTAEELDEELRKIARAKKWGGGADSMDTT